MRVWFNRHFKLVANVVSLLREIDSSLPIAALISNRRADFAGFAAADEWFLEPSDLNEHEYVDWCLRTAIERRVEWLVPGHAASALAADSARFSTHGIKLLNAAAADVLPRLHQKDWVYANTPSEIPLPRFESVSDYVSLHAAVAALQTQGPTCIKPTVSVYGLGFHRLADDAVLADSSTLDLATWHERYGACTAATSQLVMQYLPGHEYSVDLACQEGDLLAGVVRRKPLTGAWRSLEDRPDLIAHARRLVEHFGLHGLINVQFKDDEHGTPHLLEINPRASGGIGMSCLSGINLPALAYSACMTGRHLPVPTPRLGIRVVELPIAFELPQVTA